MSALFFGLFHGNLVQGIYAGTLGLVLAWVMERYQTLTSVWLVHAAMNLGSVYVLDGVLMPMTGNSWILQIVIAVISLGVMTAEIYRLKEVRA